MGQTRTIRWGPLMGAMAAGACVAGVVVWRLDLMGLEQAVTQKRAALKKLNLSGSIPVNEKVLTYLKTRQQSVESRYQHWLKVATTPALAEAASADPQLYFQQQVHDLQRMLERLALARQTPVPEQLGFPKTIPPPETVPRLSAQVALIQAIAELMLEQGLGRPVSFKVEDPQPWDASSESASLVGLPVRVRWKGTLVQLMKVLEALQGVRPIIDVQGLRISDGSSPTGELDVELLLARYLSTVQ